MRLLSSVFTISSASVISQLIGALSILVITHKYTLSDVGIYSLYYSIAVTGAQVCTFASHLLIPKLRNDEVPQNVIFCFFQILFLAIPYTVVATCVFDQDGAVIYTLTCSIALGLISENLSLRYGKIYFLIFQRISMSLVVMVPLLLSNSMSQFYHYWMVSLLLLVVFCVLYIFDVTSIRLCHLRLGENFNFFKNNSQHISKIGSAEVLAMANNNLPIMLINLWFSPLAAGCFSIVTRFCLAPSVIIGNAVRNSIFSRWSLDFRNDHFNYNEFRKVRLFLFIIGLGATCTVYFLYPVIISVGFSTDLLNSVSTSRYMLFYLFATLAICPLTVVELIFGSQCYFLIIQVQQFAIVLLTFIFLPFYYHSYDASVMLFSIMTFIRYVFVYIKLNQRADSLRFRMETL